MRNIRVKKIASKKDSTPKSFNSLYHSFAYRDVEQHEIVGGFVPDPYQFEPVVERPRISVKESSFISERLEQDYFVQEDTQFFEQVSQHEFGDVTPSGSVRQSMYASDEKV